MARKQMTHEAKLNWMARWASDNKCTLAREGECGFGRECVGIIASNSCYPDYEWDDPKTYERLDENGDVWCPEDAYHKSPVVAVLGRGEKAEAQLYDWLKWFDANGFVLEVVEEPKSSDQFAMMMSLVMNRGQQARMTRKPLCTKSGATGEPKADAGGQGGGIL